MTREISKEEHCTVQKLTCTVLLAYLHSILYHSDSTFPVYFVRAWQDLATAECVLTKESNITKSELVIDFM